MAQKLKSYLRHTQLYRKVGAFELYLRGRLFDLKHRVRTSDTIELSGLDIKGASVNFGFRYAGADPKLLHHIFGHLRIDYGQFVFVDLGSGMGRVLLVASEFPFKRIVGVEFARELHEIAMRNISNYRSASRKCKKVESLCMDAIDFSLPEGPTIIFLFNPFKETILAPVLANIRKSLEHHPREILIIYLNPELGHLLDREQAFTKLLAHDWYSVYGSACATDRLSRAVENLRAAKF